VHLNHQLEAEGYQTEKGAQPGKKLILFGDQTRSNKSSINLDQNAIQALEIVRKRLITLRAFIDVSGKNHLRSKWYWQRNIEEEALGKNLYFHSLLQRKKGSGIGLSLSKQISAFAQQGPILTGSNRKQGARNYFKWFLMDSKLVSESQKSIEAEMKT